MKKSLFFVAAASALMLTACSSENDVVQNTTPTTQTTVQQQAVGFDLYTQSATNARRAGDPEGVMTTDKLKTLNKGFGVFAMYTGTSPYAATFTPNFMFNEHIHWLDGWTYSPLKYWPNDTDNDSQTPAATMTELEKISFFAYAPYVDLKGTGSMETNRTSSAPVNAYIGSPSVETSGIISYSKEDRNNDPLVEWGYTTNLDNNVDLLWGVAPNGMDYTSVKGTNVTTTFGKPLLNLVKPNKDQKIKFLFQHALSRIGLSVVSSIDQVAPGDDGGVYKNDQTRVLIKSVEVYGDFGKQGVLNLNNTDKGVNTANWIGTSILQSSDEDTDPLFYFDNNTKYKDGEVAINGYIAPDLRYVQSQINAVTGTVEPAVAADPDKFAEINTGVLPSEQTLIAGNKDDSKEVTDKTFVVGNVYYKANTGTDHGYSVATTSATNAVNAYTLTGDYETAGSYITQVFETDGNTKATVSGRTPQLYTFTVSAEKTNADGDHLAADAKYYTKDGNKYTYHVATGSESTTMKYYTITDKANLPVANYEGTIYSGLIPRYFMVIPTGETDIVVKIRYAVVTKDEKLATNVSEIENYVTKKVTVDLKSGKSYNLKLILGLTSVKLDATVADWQVADDAEIYLPKNN